MVEMLTRPIQDPADWLGSEMIQRTEWILELQEGEREGKCRQCERPPKSPCGHEAACARGVRLAGIGPETIAGDPSADRTPLRLKLDQQVDLAGRVRLPRGDRAENTDAGRAVLAAYGIFETED